MGEWTSFTLEELGAKQKSAFATGPFGSAVSSKNFVSSGIPMLRGSNLSEDIGTRLDHQDLVFIGDSVATKYDRSIAHPGDLIFTCWGTVGQIGLVESGSSYESYLVSNKQMKMTPDPSICHSLFLYYYLSQRVMVDLVKGQSIGSSVPGFNLGQLKALPVRIPSVAIQRAIAEVLGALDDKIAANERVALAAEGLLEAESAKVVDSAERFTPLTSCAEVRKGVSYRSADLQPSTTALVTLKSVTRTGGFSHSGFKEYVGEFSGDQVLETGDIVVAQTDITQGGELSLIHI